MIRLAAFALVAGCAGRTYIVTRATPAVHVEGSSVQGADLSISLEGNGVGLSIDAEGQRLKRPVFDGTQSRIGGGIGVGARVSLFGLFSGNHELDHWFDLGASGTAGGGLIYPARLTTFGEVSGGGWVAFGLYPGVRHPALVVELRRVAVTDWDNMTIVTVGISLTSRTFESFGPLHD